MAGLELPFGVKVLNPLSLDEKYLSGGTTPYSSVSNVNSLIPQSIRHRGLTVNISGDEYWYKDGVTDADLVIKTGNSGVTTGDTLGTGYAVFKEVSGDTMLFRSIGGTAVQLSGDTLLINISGSTSEKVKITTVNYTILADDDYIGVSGASTITLPASPILGKNYEVADVKGDAETNNITIQGNGNKILNDTYAVINTDYGEISLRWNGIHWSVISFVN